MIAKKTEEEKNTLVPQSIYNELVVLGPTFKRKNVIICSSASPTCDPDAQPRRQPDPTAVEREERERQQYLWHGHQEE